MCFQLLTKRRHAGDQVTRLPAYGSLYNAQSWESSDYSGWGHLPEFWVDARTLPGDLKTRYAHLARFARNFPGTQNEAARVMDDILPPIPIDLKSLNPKS